jgi:ATP-binding cassette, subfamily B, bacterial
MLKVRHSVTSHTTPPAQPWRFLGLYLRRHLPLSGAAFIAVISGASCAVGAQYSLKLLIDRMSSSGRDATIMPLALDVGLFLSLLAAESAFWRLGGWLGSRAIIRIGADIRLDLFDQVIGQSWRFFTSQTSGALSGRIPSAAKAATAVLSTLIWNIVPPCADLLGSIIVLMTIDWRLAAALLVSIMVLTTLLRSIGAQGFPLHRAYHARSAEVLGEIADVISNIALLHAFDSRRRERDRMQQQVNQEASAHTRSWTYLERTRCVHDISFWFVTAALLSTSVLIWHRGGITTGDVVVASTLALRVLNGSRELALSLLGLAEQLSGVAEATKVLCAPLDVVETEATPRLQPCGGPIDFHEVSFAQDGASMLFREFDLHVPAGQRLGIVGPSGAGKSTLFRLLQRQIGLQSGSIRIGHQAIDVVTRRSLAATFAVVTQEVTLLHRSVMENLRYGHPDASDDEVYAVAKAAGCDAFIRALPRQYESLVGERGVRLSGGQRQRIAIARAMLKKSPIILLDEATSALDTESEIEVQAGLLRLTKGLTVLSVAHRLSTIMNFDRVIVLQDGRIVEDGPPHELCHGRGPFGRMWRLQDSVSHIPVPEASDINWRNIFGDTDSDHAISTAGRTVRRERGGVAIAGHDRNSSERY